MKPWEFIDVVMGEALPAFMPQGDRIRVAAVVENVTDRRPEGYVELVVWADEDTAAFRWAFSAVAQYDATAAELMAVDGVRLLAQRLYGDGIGLMGGADPDPDV